MKLELSRHSYASAANQTLHFCRSTANELIFTTDYEPAQDRVQMDLFFDSAPVCAANDLIRAIIDKRENEVSRLMSQLKSLTPENHQKFARLLALHNELTVSRKSSDRKIKLLQQTVTL